METWGEHLDAVRETYSETANAIARFEPVTFIAKPKNVAEVSLITGNGVATLSMPHDDFFLKDMAPASSSIGRAASPAWTGCGTPGADAIPITTATPPWPRSCWSSCAMRRYLAPLVLEGGAIDGDGEGTLLASEVLLNPNRNPKLAQAEIERHLEGFLGVSKIIWLAGGIAGDPAGGLIDNVVCFVKPGVVLALVTADTADANYAALQDNLQRLKAATDAKGRQLEVIEIEQPRSSLGKAASACRSPIPASISPMAPRSFPPSRIRRTTRPMRCCPRPSPAARSCRCRHASSAMAAPAFTPSLSVNRRVRPRAELSRE